MLIYLFTFEILLENYGGIEHGYKKRMR